MATSDQRMELIGSTILEQAKQEAEQILRGAGRMRDQKITRYQDELVDRMYNEMQKDAQGIRREGVKDRSRLRAEMRRELLVRRQELCDDIFADVRARLLEYAGTEAYRTALLDGLRKLKDAFDHSGSTVLLRKDDLALAADIRSMLKGCTVSAGKNIELGGFCLLNEKAGVMVDESLDERLRDQKSWFLENSGLRVV